MVLATVGVPPTTATAPPLTRIVPAALRLIVDGVVGVVTEDGEHAVRERRGRRRARRLARCDDDTGTDHGADEQPAAQHGCGDRLLSASLILQFEFERASRRWPGTALPGRTSEPAHPASSSLIVASPSSGVMA